MRDAWDLTNGWRSIKLGLVTLVSAAGLLSSTAIAADKIAVGTGIDPGFAHFYIAKANGYWDKRGLDVEVKLFASGAASVSSIIAGDVVAVNSGQLGCLLAAAKSPKVVLAAQTYASDKLYGVVSTKDIASAKDLKGKKFATALGSGAHFFTSWFLKQNGMTAKDVDLISVDAPEMMAALSRGDIAAYAAWEPWVTRASTALGDKVRVVRSDGFDYQAWICLDKDWATKSPKAALAFMQGLADADTLIRSDPAKAAEVVARYLKMDVALTKQLMDTMRFNLMLTEPTISHMVDATNWIVGEGKIKPLNYQAFVYPDLLRAAKPEAVNFTLPK